MARRWFPYPFADARRDAVAGVTVAVMLIPQAMAYALLLGVPPIHGLYASVVPLALYGLLGTARHVAAGVVAIDMLIASAGLAGLAARGSEEYVQLVIVLTLTVGVLQLVMGFARVGFFVNLLSRPVVVGLTSGAALLIATSQLGPLLGIPIDGTDSVPEMALQGIARLGDTNLASLGLGVIAMGSMLVLPGRWPRVPAPLVAVLVTTGVTVIATLERYGVAVIGPVPAGLPSFAIPSDAWRALPELLPTALTLALVQIATVTSLGKTFAARYRYSISPNHELLALGAANVGGALLHGLPVSGSYSRSAVNARAGAVTPLANVFAAAAVLVAILLLTPTLRHIPVPALSAIVVVAAVGLLDMEQIRFLGRIRSSEGGVALVTFAGTLLLGIVQGLVLGVLVAVAVLLFRIGRPNTAVLGHLPGTRSFRDVSRVDAARAVDGIMILRLDASFSFMNAEYLKDIILRQSRDPEGSTRAVVIDASTIIDLDATATAVIEFVTGTMRDRGVTLLVAGVRGPVLDVMRRAGLYDLIGPENFFLSPHRAVLSLLTAWGESDEYLAVVPRGHDVEEDAAPTAREQTGEGAR